ncbi:MAG TPA: ABC transporter ATP-binding protein [Trebonia sp.]|jgi:ATP-binding cassette subfamily B protein|nr:ABC transporter ATP-binding protein [Trebonia sp.]
MTPTAPEATGGDRLLLSVARQGVWWLALLAAAALTENAALVLLPAAIGQAIDAILTRAGTVSHIAACVLLVIVIVAADAATDLASGISGATATARLRRVLAAHVINLGPRLAASGFSGGDTVSRLVAGAADAGTGPASVVLAVAAVIPPLGSVVALGLIDPWLVVAFAIGFPVLALVLRRLVRDASGVAVGYAQAQGDIAARLLDALAGARTIAAAGTQDRERDRVLRPLATLRAHGYASWRIQARAAAQGMTIAPALQIIVVAVAGVELARRQITAGDLVAASQYAVLAVGIGASVGLVSRLGRARAGAARAAGPLAVPPVRYGPRELPPGRGELRLTGVSVRHGDDIVLRDLNLTVPAGAMVAVVGRSGAGKSTLARLAGRLADPDAGTVTLDGTDLRALTRTSLRTSVGYAFERPELIGATPRDAISFGLARPTGYRLRAAVLQAQADGFLSRLPRQLNTPLADAPLSGGEVQRLGLARAFAHAGATRLLVLDDATSSLDTVTELLVARAITRELTGRTRLIVAHRAATAARADLVAWLDGGRVRALAHHQELWADGDYRALFGTETAEC